MTNNDDALSLSKKESGKSINKGTLRKNGQVKNNIFDSIFYMGKIRHIAEEILMSKKDKYSEKEAIEQIGRLSDILHTARKDGDEIIIKLARVAKKELKGGQWRCSKFSPAKETEDTIKPILEQLDKRDEQKYSLSAKNNRLDKDEIYIAWWEEMDEQPPVDNRVAAMLVKVDPMLMFAKNEYCYSLSVKADTVLKGINKVEREFIDTKIADLLADVKSMADKWKIAGKTESRAIKKKILKLLHKVIHKILNVKLDYSPQLAAGLPIKTVTKIRC